MNFTVLVMGSWSSQYSQLIKVGLHIISVIFIFNVGHGYCTVYTIWHNVIFNFDGSTTSCNGLVNLTYELFINFYLKHIQHETKQ